MVLKLFHFILEYKQLIKKAKRDKKFPRGVKIELIKTNQTIRQTVYGILGLSEEKIKQRELNYKRERKERYLEKIKTFVKKLLS